MDEGLDVGERESGGNVWVRVFVWERGRQGEHGSEGN